MKLFGRKGVFNIIGSLIVGLWLVMIGLMVYKNEFSMDRGASRLGTGSEVIDSRHRQWMEIYLKGQKVGYSMNEVSPLKGGEAYLIVEEIFLRLNLMGVPSDMLTRTRCLVDKGFHLKNFDLNIVSGAIDYHVSGEVKNGWIHVHMPGDGEGEQVQKINISSEPPMIGAGLPHFFKGRSIQVGDSFEFPLFDPSTMSQKKAVLEVVDIEDIVIHRIKYTAYRLEARLLGQQVTFWIDKKGRVLREEGFMGLRLVRSNASRATKNISGSGGEDFYAMAAVPVKHKFSHPQRLSYIKLKIEGLEESGFDTGLLNKGRQRYREKLLEIREENLPTKASYRLPFPESGGEMAPFLASELHLQADAREIKEVAREVAGEHKSPLLVARKLVVWVHENIEKRPVVAVPDALEVLESRVGDCNEHAVLLTALLRASGIPARLCAGLVYARGKFYYHAWSEGYLGRWVSMDATLNQMPVDVTHIKMIEGGLDKQMDIISLIGNIGLEVLDYGYD